MPDRKEPVKPIKVIRLNYLKARENESPTISLIGGDEDSRQVRIAADSKSFLSVTPKGIALSPGMGNSFAIQGMSSNMIYGGMLQDLPFPLALLPTTPFTPFPKQMIRLPFLGLFGQMGQAFALAGACAGI